MERATDEVRAMAPVIIRWTGEMPCRGEVPQAFLAWTRSILDAIVPNLNLNDRAAAGPTGAVVPQPQGGIAMSGNGRDRQFVSGLASGAAGDAYLRFLDRTVSNTEAEIRRLQRLRARVLSGEVSHDEANRVLLADKAMERARAVRWAKLKRRVQHSRVRRVAPMRSVAARRGRRTTVRRRTRTSALLRAKGPPEPPETTAHEPDARGARCLTIIRRGGRRG
jgi:hypothetical protein